MAGHILVINPGSTSTKIALYQGNDEVFKSSTPHSIEELKKYKNIADQYEFRADIIVQELQKHRIKFKDLTAVIGRGGLLRPIPSGTYEINTAMLTDLQNAAYGEHASNLGALLAYSIAQQAGCRSFIADPVVVDEMAEIARISGNPKLPRVSIFHALNHKRIARAAACQLGCKYDEINLIVAHMGGGISVGIHERGQVVDVNNALDGDGPFSPERSGGVPIGPLLRLCFSGEFSQQEIKKQIVGEGGLVAYLGTNDAQKIQHRVDTGDGAATLIYDAMAYQVAKEIGMLATVVCGEVTAIVLTGGLANDRHLTENIERRVSFIAPVLIFAGEDELGALLDAAIRVLSGEEEARVY